MIDDNSIIFWFLLEGQKRNNSNHKTNWQQKQSTKMKSAMEWMGWLIELNKNEHSIMQHCTVWLSIVYIFWNLKFWTSKFSVLQIGWSRSLDQLLFIPRILITICWILSWKNRFLTGNWFWFWFCCKRQQS